MSRTLCLVAVIILLGGCVEVESALDTEGQAVVTHNGVRLNGVRLNGVLLNGVRLNGVRLNGVRLNGVRLDGVSLQGSLITAIEDGVPVPTDDLIGSTWDGRLSDGSILPLRIDAISPGTDANHDVYLYRISYLSTAGWSDLCEPDAAGPVAAIAVLGTWNYAEGVPGGGAYEQTSGDFTFACRGRAIAKCVEMGYKPWNGYAPYLATCTRTLRGDFCGDGQPYTVDGTTINLYDSAGVQRDTEPWIPEAEWSPDGAACITAARLTRFDQTVQLRPPCLEALRVERCPGFGHAIRIRTELPPAR